MTAAKQRGAAIPASVFTTDVAQSERCVITSVFRLGASSQMLVREQQMVDRWAWCVRVWTSCPWAKSCRRLSLTWPEDGGHVFTFSSKHSRSSPCAHSERHRHHPHQDVHTACVQRLGPLFAAACKRVPLRVFSRPPPPPIRRAQPGLIPLGLQFGMPTSQASPPVRDVVGSYCT